MSSVLTVAVAIPTWMPNLVFSILVLVIPVLLGWLVSKLPQAIFDPESYTASKACGACGRGVSLSAKSGQTCPHCGVRWSYERTFKNWDAEQARNVTAIIVGVVAFVVMGVLFYQNVILPAEKQVMNTTKVAKAEEQSTQTTTEAHTITTIVEKDKPLQSISSTTSSLDKPSEDIIANVLSLLNANPNVSKHGSLKKAYFKKENNAWAFNADIINASDEKIGILQGKFSNGVVMISSLDLEKITTNGKDTDHIKPRGYTINNNGTVTDNVTKLIWQQADDGVTRNFENASAYCRSLNLAGSKGWRLPTIKELQTLLKFEKFNPDFVQTNPTIDTTAFPGTKSSSYWSSSSPEGYAIGYKLIVSFKYGSVEDFPKTYTYYARCVRSGQ